MIWTQNCCLIFCPIEVTCDQFDHFGMFQFQLLCKTLDLDALAQAPQYSDNKQRVLHRQELFVHLQAKAGQFNREELLHRLHQMGVPAGAVRTMPEVFAESAAQELLLHWALPDGTEVRSVRSVVFEFE